MGYIEIVKLLLDKEEIDLSPINNDLVTPLIVAVKKGHTNIVQLLLEKKFDPNKTNKYGETPLLKAVCLDITDNIEVDAKMQIVKMLLEGGANPNLAEEHGLTPLLMAIKKGDKDIAELLLEKEANPNPACISGETPLSIAVEKGDKDIVELLLDRGAKIDKKSATSIITNIFLKTGDENPDLKKKILEALIVFIKEVEKKEDFGYKELDEIFKDIEKQMPQVAAVGEQGFEISGGAAASAAPSADRYSESKGRLSQGLGKALEEISAKIVQEGQQPSSSPAASSTQPAVEGAVECARE